MSKTTKPRALVLQFDPNRPRAASPAVAARNLPEAVTALKLHEKLTIAAQHYPEALPILDSVLSRMLWRRRLIDDATYAAIGHAIFVGRREGRP